MLCEKDRSEPSSISAATTVIPSSTNLEHIARPIPPPAPVTSATGPSRPLISISPFPEKCRSQTGRRRGAKFELLNLPGCGALDGAEFDCARDFELRHASTAKLDDLIRRDAAFVGWLQLDECTGHLAPTLVRAPRGREIRQRIEKGNVWE